MISQGATDFNSALINACYNGYGTMIELMIDHGANDWNGGLNAYISSDKVFLKVLLSYG